VDTKGYTNHQLAFLLFRLTIVLWVGDGWLSVTDSDLNTND